MATRLLVLWLLAEGPLHGYRIRAILSDPGFAPWLALEDASIYAMLRSLTKQGLAALAGQQREGARPARTLYRITAAGRRALARGLAEAWAVVAPRPEPVFAALAAQDEQEPAAIRDGLARRLAALDVRRAEVEEIAPAAPSGLLARRELALLEAEIGWLAREIHDRDRQWGGGP